ncbi:MAG: TetR/AcrR family transcriptional regulator [Deltaproteobacteria bacterium]|nr:TetR/AcrR family transcriptional regulator [Deltaproteobacteria bacterium]
MSTARSSRGVARGPTLPPRGRQPRRRLPAAERRRGLLAAAGALLGARGVDAVQIGEVAAAAGVTRQLVYRFFPSRQALIMGLLEDFADDLTRRFGEGAARSIPGSLEAVARVFVEAVCDTIEAKGAGPWHLLDSRGPDPAVARLGRRILDRLVAPWEAAIAESIGVSRPEAATVSRMVVAAGRAVLEQWHDGSLTREEAVRITTRGVSALLQGFRGSAGREERPRRRR